MGKYKFSKPSNGKMRRFRPFCGTKRIDPFMGMTRPFCGIISKNVTLLWEKSTGPSRGPFGPSSGIKSKNGPYCGNNPFLMCVVSPICGKSPGVPSKSLTPSALGLPK